jgi:general L-amino acid transport system permease protein|tara:strand:- start:2579 stop:3760 length:1182 start_codon:yes stop_codon:yes gene_type:complete
VSEKPIIARWRARVGQRDVLAQVLVALLVIMAVYWLVGNVVSNLERQNVASGFGFFNERAGFGINQTLIDYNEDNSYGRVLVVGLLNTLLVSVLGIAAASFLGFVIGIGRLSQNWLISKLAMVYIEIFRNVPLLLQIMFWYFGVLRNLPVPRQSLDLGELMFLNNRGFVLPAIEAGAGAIWYGLAAIIGITAVFWFKRRARRILVATGTIASVWRPAASIFLLALVMAYLIAGVPFQLDVPVLRGFNFRGGISVIPEFVALLLALSLYTASFIAEIVRAGIEAVDKGQREAAAALGFTRSQSLNLVIVPQALRVIIPPLTSQYLNLTKNSSLAVAIAYPDIVSVFAGTTLTQVGQAVEIILVTMLIYLTLSLLTSLIMNWYNARIALAGGTHG